MGIDEYGQWARQAGGEETTEDSPDTHLAILALSLAGDVSEVGEVVKRRLRYGTLDRERLAYELGDVIYYWARLGAASGVAPSAVLDESRRHIEARLAKRVRSS